MIIYDVLLLLQRERAMYFVEYTLRIMMWCSSIALLRYPYLYRWNNGVYIALRDFDRHVPPFCTYTRV
jgi:hypothetical protein